MPDWRSDFRELYETIRDNYAYWPLQSATGKPFREPTKKT